MLYTVNEATFDLPAELHDQSVNVFTATPSGASPFNIVITRAMIEDAGLTLAEHVTREVALQQQTLAGFVHEWRRDHVVDGRPAEITAARIGGREVMEQRQVYTLAGDRSLTITASARDGFDPDQLETLRQFIDSFRFRS